MSTAPPSDSDGRAVAADNPIEKPAQDVLGRTAVARRFAEQVLAQDVRSGLVVGVLGPWGSGKTSFVNLARLTFADAEVPVLDFNPWMFSGAEQLVSAFFIEVSAQLRLRPGLGEIGENLESYGELFAGLGWLPLIGTWIERAREVGKLAAKVLKARREGVKGRREKLEAALLKLDRPIIVVLDDVDRLRTSEIRDIFKLIRLTASVPNVVYLVAFDRHRVELALEDQGIPGRDYLEKIIQVGVDLPAIPDHVLDRQIFAALDGTLESIDDPGHFDQEAWPDVFVEVIRPLVHTMRDVRRYALAVEGTIRALDGQIELVDVIALEAIRVFLPDVFADLHASVAALTTPGPGLGGRDDPKVRDQINALLGAGGEDAAVVEAMIMRLFPAAQRHLPSGTNYGGGWANRWLRDRRVAHVEILRLYLERVAGSFLSAFFDAERAWAVLGDEAQLSAVMDSLAPEVTEDVIAALEAYEDEFAPEHVVPATTVLLNLLPHLPERPRGFFSFDARMVVGRVVYRLFKVIEDPADVEAAARTILPNLRSLSAKLELLNLIGHREGSGHKFLSQEAAALLEAELRAEVRVATAEVLASEHDLGGLLFFVVKMAEDGEEGFVIPDDPRVTAALLRGSRSDVRSQSVGTRAVRTSPRLAWDHLVEFYGSEDTLTERIATLKASDVAVDPELLDLAAKYAEGWRPKDFGR